MGGKFLVFVMMYLMVDISLVLGYNGGFEIRKPDGRDDEGKLKYKKVKCVWMTVADHYPDQFKVVCGAAGEINCVYQGNPRRNQVYRDRPEDFFKKLGAKAYASYFRVDNICKADHDLVAFGVHYHKM